MDGIKVNFGALEGLAADIRSASQQIQSSLDALEADVNKLSANWDGEAQQSYRTAKSKWDGQINEMNQLLDGLSVKVTDAGSAYQSTETKNAARFV